MSATAFDLDTFERWMQHVITHPDGVPAGLVAAQREGVGAVDVATLDRAVLPSNALSSLDRLSIYSNMYIWRLIDILADDFVAVRHAVGPERFGEIARAYLAAHPSTHFSLNMLGAGFAAFLRDGMPDLEHRAFLAELAALERAIQEVFDAEEVPSVSSDDLLGIPAERWAEARLAVIPAFRLFAFAYPVNAYLQAIRDDEDPAIPGPRPSWLMIYRRDYTVWRQPLSSDQHAVLRALDAGQPLGAGLEAALDIPDADPERVGRLLGEWFQDWAGEGLFAAVELPGS